MTVGAPPWLPAVKRRVGRGEDRLAVVEQRDRHRCRRRAGQLERVAVGLVGPDHGLAVRLDDQHAADVGVEHLDADVRVVDDRVDAAAWR